jgi:hypothetical protein
MNVLLVEDSPGDVRLTQETFREANMGIHLHVACDGVEAMALPVPILFCLISTFPKWMAARFCPRSNVMRVSS